MNWTTVLGFTAHVHKRGEPIRGIHLDFDDGTLEADDGAGIDFGQHTLSVCETEGMVK